jgi:hypothetical protein
MNRYVYSSAAERLRLAWAALPAEKKAAIEPMIEAAHSQVRAFAQTGMATHHPRVPHHLMLLKTALTHDQENLVPKLPGPDAPAGPQVSAGLAAAPVLPGVPQVVVAPNGDIFGTAKYEILDPGWVESAAIWLEHLVFGRHSFPTGQPQVIQIPDNVKIAIAGDWGTGPYGFAPGPSAKVANVMTGLNPDYTIHLGDVYYAGTGGEEMSHFINLWPSGSTGSFALNSNHEMYSGGGPYFSAVSGGNFSLQAGVSYFALENSNWIIIGLDSAYFSNELAAYENGSLGSGNNDPQIAFLQQTAARAHTQNKKVLLLTHHNGLEEDGSNTTGLWNDVMTVFPVGTAPAYWYWGHVHVGAVYTPQANGTLCRCAGHGALPQGLASELNNPNVLWFEHSPATEPPGTVRVLNGCVLLQFAGQSLTETFFDENGSTAWASNQHSVAAT